MYDREFTASRKDFTSKIRPPFLGAVLHAEFDVKKIKTNMIIMEIATSHIPLVRGFVIQPWFGFCSDDFGGLSSEILDLI